MPVQVFEPQRLQEFAIPEAGLPFGGTEVLHQLGLHLFVQKDLAHVFGLQGLEVQHVPGDQVQQDPGILSLEHQVGAQPHRHKDDGHQGEVAGVHEALAEKNPQPDLIVYLRASLETLMQRIALRDRSYERNIERGYIADLNEAYEAYFGTRDQSGRAPSAPVLVIDTNTLNFVKNPADLGFVENRIRQALQLTPFQPELPFENLGSSS